MNTSALKSFAPDVRNHLLEAVERKLDYTLTADTPDLREKGTQVASLRRQSDDDREALIERAAYTWFNRLAALRFLDARHWHPFRSRVLTPATDEETQPELLKQFRNGSLPDELSAYVDAARLRDLLDGRLPTAIAGADAQGEVYRHLILAACRYYHALMPFMFEEIDDETELLLPDDLLTQASPVEGFRTEILDKDCEEVEVLGWLYQFYISEKKDEVMARKKAVPSKDIPAITQLFTPHWIVRYLVENTLGNLWLRSRPNSSLKEHMPYYVEDPEGQTPAGSMTVATPEEIKLLDPACGSGHMLTYAFDLLVKIYEEEGHAPSEIPEKIFTHNLFGLDICPRAAQLAQFALVCKAREQSRAAFRRPVQPQIMRLQNIDIAADEIKAWMDTTNVTLSEEELTQIHQFRANTETFGALIQPVLDREQLSTLKQKVPDQIPAGDLLVINTHRNIQLVLEQVEMLSQRYQIVTANPPYVWEKRLNPATKQLLSSQYADFKSNLFAAFYARSDKFTVAHGRIGFMTPNVWMFLSSYQKMRDYILHQSTIRSLIQLENGAFEGAAVAVCAYITTASPPAKQDKGTFIRLADFKGAELQSPMVIKALAEQECSWKHVLPLSEFSAIPGEPLAYWVDTAFRKAFEELTPLSDMAQARQGLATGHNDTFLRFWPEIGISKFKANCTNREAASASGAKWFPYNKGGSFRKWYGNQDFVLNWENDGQAIKQKKADDLETGKCTANNAKCWNQDYYFQSGLSWSGTGVETFGARLAPEGFVFDVKGSTCFVEKSKLMAFLSFFNSTVPTEFLKILNPSTEFQAGNIKMLPLSLELHTGKDSSGFEEIATQALKITSDDWNNFETSWDFYYLPLLRPGDWEVEPGQPGGAWKGRNLAESWNHYSAYCNAAIGRMQALETENNRLWIDAYGLQDELPPQANEDHITLVRADTKKDMAAFLSYAVGCMMGRYSLDKPGLILADAADTVENYLAKVGMSLHEIQFLPDEDAIVPVLDGEWFEDDIVARTREFLRVTFGEDTLNENLRFIEESLGKSLRKYFLTDFYKDHIQRYKKRPIYWMFQSPKKGFNALIYLHRYTPDSINVLLNDYLRDYLKKIESRLIFLNETQVTASTTKEKTAARKETDKLLKIQRECQEWERDTLLPLAQQRIDIDLDDGVKANYPKFAGAVAKVAGL